MHYPLTLDLADRGSKFAKSSIAGEFIQHLCDDSAAVKPMPPSAIPYCALEEYRLAEPQGLAWDLPGSNATIVANPMECQERCQQTAECAYFTFVYKTGACHMESASATMTAAPGVSSGPKECPVTTPGPLTPCNVHPKCVSSMETGMCCPNADGIVLGCCDLTQRPQVSTFSDNSGVTRVGSSGQSGAYLQFSYSINMLDYDEINPQQNGLLSTGYSSVSSSDFEPTGAAS